LKSIGIPFRFNSTHEPNFHLKLSNPMLHIYVA